MNEFQADAIFEEEREKRAGITAIVLPPNEPKTTFLNCGDETGYLKGKEPTRHDIHWCSSRCWKEFFDEL